MWKNEGISWRYTHIILPDGVTAIGVHAFQGCRSLTQITLSDRVKEIRDDAFKGCISLSSIYILTDDARKFEAIKALLLEEVRDKAVQISKNLQKKVASLRCQAIKKLLSNSAISALSKCVDLPSDMLIEISHIEGIDHPLTKQLIEKINALGFPKETDEGLKEYEAAISQCITPIVQAEEMKRGSEPSFSVIEKNVCP